VLDVFQDESVRERVLVNGRTLCLGLEALTEESPYVAEVRGSGLYLGVEIVKDRETLEPDSARTEDIIKDMRDRRVLISRTGPTANVLKIRPPLAFTAEDATRLLETFAVVAKHRL
jgi:4-aminobutyrate aminotransferase-like enzyme